MLNVLFIETDDQKNLGGSCTRDLKNIDNYLDKCEIQRRSTTLLYMNEFKMKDHYHYNSLKNYKESFDRFVSEIKEGDSAFIMISGHGYQKRDDNGDEKDGLDEYISYITDDELYNLLTKIKHKCKRIVCLTDTCHSGTMFDLDNNKEYNNIISLSACSDNELSSCDISDVAGFGGSLTVHLLSIQNSLEILLTDNFEDIKEKIYNPLKDILSLLGQKPIINII